MRRWTAGACPPDETLRARCRVVPAVLLLLPCPSPRLAPLSRCCLPPPRVRGVRTSSPARRQRNCRRRRWSAARATSSIATCGYSPSGWIVPWPAASSGAAAPDVCSTPGDFSHATSDWIPRCHSARWCDDRLWRAAVQDLLRRPVRLRRDGHLHEGRPLRLRLRQEGLLWQGVREVLLRRSGHRPGLRQDVRAASRRQVRLRLLRQVTGRHLPRKKSLPGKGFGPQSPFFPVGIPSRAGRHTSRPHFLLPCSWLSPPADWPLCAILVGGDVSHALQRASNLSPLGETPLARSRLRDNP